MDDGATLPEVFALLQRGTGEPLWWGYRIGAGRREFPLSVSLPCRMCIHKPLSVKRFHGVSVGNVHACSLKSRIGKVRIFMRGSVRLGVNVRNGRLDF